MSSWRSYVPGRTSRPSRSRRSRRPGGKLASIAYSRAGQLGTDLNRDILRESLAGQGVQPVRQVAIDQVWSGAAVPPGLSHAAHPRTGVMAPSRRYERG
ncbi:MAG: hypothetical protein ACLPKE_17800 [Streptosporangiaceae bacterium]